jgi:uncharacterized protein (UPF0335 family)
MEKENLTIFDRNVVEFVTAAAGYCQFLEQSEGMQRRTFVGTAVKILPLLYVKATLLPPCSSLSLEELECYVTEEIYEIQRISIANIMEEKDDYLDSFVSEMEYSEEPIKKNISEDLTDIYQDIKDFVFVFKLGLNETMSEALAKCEENFKTIWGPKLLSALRALHHMLYQEENEEGEGEEESPQEEPEEEKECNCDDDECHCHHH